MTNERIADQLRYMTVPVLISKNKTKNGLNLERVSYTIFRMEVVTLQC